MLCNANGAIFDKAKTLIPGGVNSPARAFASVGGTPPFIAAGSGSHIRDIEGREFIDFVSSWGPLILGHAHPMVVEAVREAAGRGTSFGAPTAAEVRLAELIVECVAPIEKVRLVNSGTEATQVRRLLSRPRRLPSGRRRVGRYDPLNPIHAGRAERFYGTDRRCSLQ